ncbi:hypothetical protein LCGC14_2289840 [marine sediment metagenome]|uniref:Acb2/Tad1 hairpin domain-containing protein n=1 Tax=marine sediment metagenome TaxID=412755 RepID=A0A0F9DE51_9ZZZZ
MGSSESEVVNVASPYGLSCGDKSRLDREFMFHPPKPDQSRRYEVIRAKAKDYAWQLMVLCPPSLELSMAVTRLEEAVMWASAAIARNESGELPVGE